MSTTTLFLLVTFNIIIAGVALAGLIQYYSIIKRKRKVKKILDDFYKNLNNKGE